MGGPYIEASRGQARWKGAFSAVTATVVGVIAHLGLTFGQSVFVTSTEAQWPLDFGALAVALLAFAAMTFAHWSIPRIVLAGALMGLLRSFAG